MFKLDPKYGKTIKKFGRTIIINREHEKIFVHWREVPGWYIFLPTAAG